MKVSSAQIAEFEEQGYLFLPSLFTPEEMAVLKPEIPGILAAQREVAGPPGRAAE